MRRAGLASTSRALEKMTVRNSGNRIGIALMSFGFVLSIFFANWATERWGFVPVGFGLDATAGVYIAWAALVIRDLLHDRAGRWPVVGLILVGGVMSYGIAPAFAVASAVAFLVSESVDLLVYEPLRKRGRIRAVFASSIIGSVVDTALFLWIAFGSLNSIEGQLVAKGYMTGIAVVVLWGIARVQRSGVAYAPVG